MKLTIKKIIKRDMDTQYGRKVKFSIQDEQGQWYDAWEGKWTGILVEGSTVDVLIKDREYRAKDGSLRKAFTLTGPADEKDKLIHEIAKDMAEVKRMLTELLRSRGSVEPPPHTDEDMPPEEPEGEAPPF